MVRKSPDDPSSPERESGSPDMLDDDGMEARDTSYDEGLGRADGSYDEGDAHHDSGDSLDISGGSSGGRLVRLTNPYDSDGASSNEDSQRNISIRPRLDEASRGAVDRDVDVDGEEIDVVGSSAVVLGLHRSHLAGIAGITSSGREHNSGLNGGMLMLNNASLNSSSLTQHRPHINLI